MSTSREPWTLLGLLSLGSGLALVCTPLKMAAIYGLPRYSALARVIGARDVLIGLRLLSSRGALGAMRSRSASDAFDALLILVEGARRRPWYTVARAAVALSTSGAAWWLARTASRQR